MKIGLGAMLLLGGMSLSLTSTRAAGKDDNTTAQTVSTTQLSAPQQDDRLERERKKAEKRLKAQEKKQANAKKAAERQKRKVAKIESNISKIENNIDKQLQKIARLETRFDTKVDRGRATDIDVSKDQHAIDKEKLKLSKFELNLQKEKENLRKALRKL